MKILDRYILKKFLTAFFFVVLILVTIICVIDITEKNDNFIQHDLSLSQVLGYYLDFIPYIANFITPITVFIATVFVTSKMAGHTEIIAILSSGVSFRRMMVPYMMGATIIAILSFFLTGYVLPNANKDRIAFEIAYVKKPFRFTDRNIHIKVAPKSYAYLESYNNDSEVGYRFSLETIDENELKAKLTARRLEWDSASSKWTLRDWELRKIKGMEEQVSRGATMDTLISLKPSDFSSTYQLQETFTLPELNNYIAELKERGADNIIIYEIEKYIRYMSPFAALILTFIGLIMSSRKSRGGSGLMIAMGFGIAFVYILFFVLAKSIAEAKALSPVIAVWVPNIVFSIVGLILYRTVPR
ncbi:LptF/LptG family permease [Nafulsella turpanensis]|uniref:LptF/LptG family permease n=1 Tax=Nafulsella turpanensis TaxID=1265690 RepID=UPI00034D3452|nr:LptF/LptG family permease [Nafulsella turpanensis]